METTYTWTAVSDQATNDLARPRRARRVRPVHRPMTAAAMQRANQKDLVNLKAILENK
jgi:hypothetical protein